MPSAFSPPVRRIVLGSLNLLVGVTAVGAAVALMSTGQGRWKDPMTGTVISRWFLPGLALLVIIGGSQLFAATALLTDKPYGRMASLAAGVVLWVWVLVQLVVWRTAQPLIALLMIALGALMVVWARRLPPNGRIWPGSDEPDPDRRGIDE